MSRHSRLSMRIEDLHEGEPARITEAINNAYGDLEVSDFDYEVYVEGTLRVSGFKGEEDISVKLTKLVWSVTKRYVEITCDWWYDDSPPDETFFYDEDSYSEMVAPLEQLASAADEENDG